MLKGHRSLFPDGREQSRADSPWEMCFFCWVSFAKFSCSHLPWMEPMMAERGLGRGLEGAGKCWRGSRKHMYKSE